MVKCVYMFLFPNKKVYVGKTVNLKKRLYKRPNYNTHNGFRFEFNSHIRRSSLV